MLVFDLDPGYDEMSSKSEFRRLCSEDDMGSATMGKVLVAARIENLDDLFGVRKGQRPKKRFAASTSQTRWSTRVLPVSSCQSG